MEMKHYKDAAGNMYGFAADGSQDKLKPAGLVEITVTQAQQSSAVLNEALRAQQIAEMDYVRQRLHTYPEIGEFLDAWVKNDQTALEEYRQKCLAIKARYPKPPGF